MEEEQQMSLIEEILSEENLSEAIKRVKANKILHSRIYGGSPRLAELTILTIF